MLIAQISDTHILPEGKIAFGFVDTGQYLARAVAHILALRPLPDVVLVTGDLVDAGGAAEYAHLRKVLAPLTMPVHVIPGNHDARAALRAAFADHHYLKDAEFLHYALEDYPLRLIGLDTLTPGAPDGELCPRRLDWLEARLKESDRPTILYMHHPPCPVGLTEMDGMRLNRGAERFGAIVARHPNIERVLCGHVHRPIQLRWSGTIVAVAPSTAHQVTLDLAEDGPLSLTMDPPAVALHKWQEGTGLVSHLSYIGKFDGPHSF